MKFSYQARSKDGLIKAGTVVAASEEKAELLLAENGLTIISLTAQKEDILKRLNPFANYVSNKDMVLFSRQLSTLIGARVPILQALRILQGQLSNVHMQEVMQDMVSAIENGESLSLALSKHPDVFSNVYVSLVRSGEASGTLNVSLSYLADQMEKEYQLKSSVRRAMTYPVFVLALLFIVGLAMFKLVLPKMIQILKDQHAELPLASKILIATTDFIDRTWYLLIIGLIAFVLFVRYYIGTESGRYLWDSMKLSIPLIGNIFQKLYITRFSRNLATLVSGGIPIIQAFKIVADVINNVIYRDIIYSASTFIAQGKGMADSLAGHKEFPEIVVQMVRVGEQTAQVDSILVKLALFYEKEVEDQVASLSSLLEPIVMVILGIGVGVLVAGVLLPIYNLAATAGA
ncbi:MAG TPA: type II secretion system F family protein [Patescibacteria group bacterium]|nr:type II secretion system F family protein [Patescibacteria group bacterium]